MIDILRFIADHSGMNLADALKEAYEQGKRDARTEREKGKWIPMNDNHISGKCSVCGWEAHLYEDDVVGMDYCPNCGARLEVKE